jgi:hypothetical protein
MANQNQYASNALIIKDFLAQVLSLKYYYIVSFLILLGIAFVVNRYSPVVVEANTVIGPIEDQRAALLGSNDLFRGLVSYEQARNIENDINNIKSFTLVSATLSKMSLEVGYFTKKSHFLDHDRQVYPDPPFHVSIDKSHIQPIDAKINFSVIDSNTYRIQIEEDEVSLYNYIDNAVISEKNVIKIDTVCKFNETVSNRYLKFVVNLTMPGVFSNRREKPRLLFCFLQSR